MIRRNELQLWSCVLLVCSVAVMVYVNDVSRRIETLTEEYDTLLVQLEVYQARYEQLNRRLREMGQRDEVKGDLAEDDGTRVRQLR